MTVAASELTGQALDNAPGTVTRALRLKDVPAEAYDRFVASHPQASPYHQRAWLLATVAAYGHEGWVVSVTRKGEWVGAMPVCRLRRPGGGPLVSLPFCDLGGPLAQDEAVLAALKAGAQTLMEACGTADIAVRIGGDALTEAQITEAEQARSARKVSMLFPLPESSDSLIKSYKPKLRSQIRKAEKNGLTSAVVRGSEGVDAFYPVFAANMRRLGSPVHSKAWFQALADAYGEQMLVGLVYADEQVVGAGIVLVAGRRACIPWASTLADFNHLAPNMLLYWALLSHVTDAGCQWFDFGRSTFGEGTYRFKKQWGAKPYGLTWVHWHSDGRVTESAITEPGNLARKLRQFIEACWQRLPLAIANWLGPKLRKHISL
ncbi:MAG: GNAT family N-acetyltransferase [Marinobacter sp.]|nr:GNAT family N-acetyltransferase [Marinobacter sp.]